MIEYVLALLLNPVANNVHAYTEDFAQIVMLDELVAFVRRLIKERCKQLAGLNVDSALFYLWFDEQAAQLRFNIISDIHASLPFQCATRKIGDVTPILEQLLSSICSEEEIVLLNADDEHEDEEAFVLNVFTTILAPDAQC